MADNASAGPATSTVDKRKTFAKKFVQDTSAMMLGPLCWIGNKLELFLHLSEHPEGVNYEEFATITKCNARYLQEWLHAMTCANWIEYNSETQKFTLPIEHQDFLVKREGNSAFAADCFNSFRIFNECAPKYLDCFQNGGGLTLNEIHPDMGEAVEAFTGTTQKYRVPVLIKGFLPDIHERLESGIVAADVGCGVGNSLVSMAKTYPKSIFYGFEPHEASFLRAKANVLDCLGDSNNVVLINNTSEAMETEKFDFVMTWDVVHDLVDPISFLKDIYRSLKDDQTSVYLMNEVPASSELTENLNENYTLAYALSMMYCTTVSLAGGGPGYGACMGEKVAQELCEKAAFSTFDIIPKCPSRLYRVKK